MKYLKIPVADKVYFELVTEAKKKGTTVAALASTKVSTYPKQLQ